MEIINVNSVESKMTKTNVPFWAVTYNGTLKATVWDAIIAQNMTACINKQGNAELKIQGNFTNIRAFTPVGEIVNTPVTQPEPTPIIPQETEGSVHSVKDNTIIAQVILKGAIELTKERRFGKKDELGPYLCMCVEELVGTYKLAFESLNG